LYFCEIFWESETFAILSLEEKQAKSRYTNMIMARDGVTITQSGNTIYCSNGETYTFSGNMLFGSGGTISSNVSSIQEAVGIVAGLHGGKMF